MENCPYYETNAKEDYLFGKIQTFCDIELCPYSNQIQPKLGGEDLPKICKTKGLVKKITETFLD
jgi:hypothetical protein